MPRITEYRQQTRSPGAVDFQRASGVSALGQGLQDIGRVVNDMTDEYDRYQRKQGEHNASQKTAEFALQDNDYVEEKVNSYNPNTYKRPEDKPEGWDFSDSLGEELEAKKQERLAGTDNQYEREALDLRLTQTNAKLVSEARSKQKNTEAKYVTENARNTQTQYANLVRSNPTKLEDSKKMMDDYYDTLPDQYAGVKDLLKNESNTVLHDSALDGYVTKLSTKSNISTGEIDKAISELTDEKGKWVKNSSKEKFDQSLSQLQKLKEVTTERNKADFQFGFKQEMDRMKITGEDRGKYTEAEIRNSGFTAKETERMVREQSYARIEAKEYSQIKDMSFEDAAKMVSPEAIEKLVKSDPENFYLVNNQAQARLNAWNKRNQLMKADPVSYVEKSSSVVQAKRDAMELALRQDPNGEGMVSAVEDYASALVSEQKRLNPYQPPTVLDANTVASIKYQIESVPSDPKGVDQAVLILQGQMKQWGKYAPVAFKDLKANEAISSSHYVAATLLTDPSKTPLAKDLIRSAIIPANKIDTTKMKDYQAMAKEELSDLRASLTNQVDGDRIAADYEESLAKLMYYYEDQNIPNKDASDIAKKMILDNYDFESGYRVPKQNGISVADKVITGSNHYLNKVELIPNLYVPQSSSGIRPIDAKNIYVNRLKANGQWVNNGDEGLQLLDGEGNNVFTQEGKDIKPVRLSWDELNLLDNEAKTKAAERKTRLQGSKF